MSIAATQTPADNTPIIIGVGQITETVPEDLTQASSHADLAAKACMLALQDAQTSELANHVDTLVTVRAFADSLNLGSSPFGMPNNLPRAIAQRVGVNPEHAIYDVLGGETPQKLTGEMCQRLINREQNLMNDESGLVLITGAEAIANLRAARRQGVNLNWREQIDGQIEDRGPTGGYQLLSDEEQRHQLIQPMQFYALMENARRADSGMDKDRYDASMGEIFSHYSDIAAHNPLSFFPKNYSPQELTRTSTDNPMLMTPYPKRLIAKDGVNQAAALLLTTVGKARELEIDPAKWVYLHGYADTKEKLFMERPNLGASPAMQQSLHAALANANITMQDVSHMDLYSCFPIVPMLAREALGLTADDPRALTTTGGLPFFGGPGNNYTLHGIASLIEKLRADPGSYGLAYGNGGWMSKHSTGIYSCLAPKQPWRTCDSSLLQQRLDNQPSCPVSHAPQGQAQLETYTVAYRKRLPEYALVIGRLHTDNKRFVARSDNPATLQYLLQHDPLGATVNVSTDPSGNCFSFADEVTVTPV